jgi:hypothetical protein
MRKRTIVFILILTSLLFAGAADSFVKACKDTQSVCCDAAATNKLMSGSMGYGTNCWRYAEGPYAWDSNQFVCDSTVQINPNKPCVVTCKNKVDAATTSCGCSLSSACIDVCSDAVMGICKRATFACSGAAYSCATGGAPTVECRDTEGCRDTCAAECGRITTCGRSCDTCCSQMQCNQATYTQTQREACLGACKGICKANEEVCNMVTLLQIITALVAAALLLINAIKWIISDDPEARTSARHGIWYVIFGLIVVAAAMALVGSLLGVSITSCNLLT